MYDFDGKELKETINIDFLAAKLGSPHQMRFGAYALYGDKKPGNVVEDLIADRRLENATS